ncbi:hypothetical protein OOK36_52470 [Streptomyces sp. NBC_00365]|uniref:hypothetical protein n=1 Tax=Streptomyces sp. NBC_00365 TaxID=2975726 RepID=UPI00225123F8|nr:hypothetical protein [Streptomyces sp. NBC_00365]MCX5097152.1 hypothetical protein [Streptomyces sp. NBC_00365]
MPAQPPRTCSAPSSRGHWTSPRGRREVIAAACLLYATALATGALTYGHAPAVLTALLPATAGTCGPLLTGGVSSRLPAIVGPRLRTQRNARPGTWPPTASAAPSARP